MKQMLDINHYVIDIGESHSTSSNCTALYTIGQVKVV